MIMRIAIITGPRAITATDETYVAGVIREIIARGFSIYVGDATGVDSIAYRLAPNAMQFHPLSILGRTPAGLAERSSRMVKDALRIPAKIICCGFPNRPCPESILPARQWRRGGSGTWSTIALANGHDIETWVFPIGGFATPPFWCGTPEKLTEEIHGWQYQPATQLLF